MKTSLTHHTYKPGSYLLIFCLMAAVGCNHAENRINNRPGSGNKVQVMAIVARPQLLDNKIFTTGTLIANEEVELRPEISGRVTDVFFREGSRLKKGDLLIKLNDRELKAELKRKEIQEKLAAEEEARAKIPNSDGYLIPGSFARVEITLETYRDAIVIPAEGLITELSGEKVYLCNNGLAQLAAVKTGIRTEKEIQILEGIMAGDTVLISGLLLLADGRPVDIKNLHHQ